MKYEKLNNPNGMRVSKNVRDSSKTFWFDHPSRRTTFKAHFC